MLVLKNEVEYFHKLFHLKMATIFFHFEETRRKQIEVTIVKIIIEFFRKRKFFSSDSQNALGTAKE